MSEPPRSAVPLASAGIILLGLVPTLGGPDQPLHWAMTAGMVGFGVLLRVRHRLRRSEGPLRPVAGTVARQAGRAMLTTVGVIAALVTTLMVLRWHNTSSSPTAALSVALPVLGLAWLTLIGVRVLRHESGAAEAEQKGDRPSRRPSSWDALSGASAGRGKATGGHASL